MGEKKNNREINVLVITQSPWSDTNALGNTYSNFFSHWDNYNFANLYLREELPDNKVCNKFYNITEKSILKNILRPWKIGKEFTTNQLNIMKSEVKYEANTKREKYILDLFRNRSIVFHILREFIWKIGNWDNRKLADFVKDTDIIVIAASGPIYLQNIANYCLKKSNAKLIMFFSDDTYCYTNTRPFNYIYKFFIRSAISKAVDNSTKLYGATKKLCEEYREYFGKEIKPLYKGCSFENIKVKKEYKFPIKIVYAGNLYYGRDKILTKLTDEIVRINESIEKINLEIYTTATITNEIDKNLNRGNSSKIMGSLPYEDIKKVLNSADIVLHVESFDTNQIKTTRLSFSTKIIDCMQSGSCMMAIGPDSVASIDYLLGIDGVISITDLSKIGDELEKIVNDPDSLKLKTEKLAKFARENHDIKTVRKELEQDFFEVCGLNKTSK